MSKKDRYLTRKLIEECKQKCSECGGSLLDPNSNTEDWLEGLVEKSLKVCDECSRVHTQKGQGFFIKGKKAYYDGVFFFLNLKDGYSEKEFMNGEDR